MAFQIPPGTNLADVPAGVPPPGVTPDLTDPSSQGTLQDDQIGVGTAMLTVAILLVGLATYNKRKKLGWSDWSRLVGLILTIGYISVVFALSADAVHQWNLSLAYYNNPRNLKLLYVQTLFLGPSIFFAKLAILLIYFEVFNVKRVTRYLIYLGFLFDFITYWPSVPLVSYFCAPHVGQSWNIETYANCANTDVWGVIQGTLATALDIYIFILPIPSIWQLQMSKQKKWAFTAVFGTGALGIVASVLSLVYRVKLYNGLNADFQWLVSELFICIMVENCVALWVSSVPAAAKQSKVIWDYSTTAYSSLLSSRTSGTKGNSFKSTEWSSKALSTDRAEGDWTEMSRSKESLSPLPKEPSEADDRNNSYQMV